MTRRAPEAPRNASLRSTRSRERPDVPPVLVVMGGRRGVGASTVAAGLAVGFATTQRTLLVDADEGSASLHEVLGVDGTRTSDDLLRGTTPDRVLTRVSPRLSLVVGRPSSLPALSAVQRRTLFHALTGLFETFVVVVIDAGSRAAPVLAACAAPTAHALVVTTGDRIAAAGAHAVEKLLHLEHPDVEVDIVGNMLDDGAAAAVRELLATAAEQFLGRTLDYVGTVPPDAALVSLLAGRAPAAGAPPASDGLLALTAIGERALATAGSSAVGRNSPLIDRSNHGTR